MSLRINIVYWDSFSLLSVSIILLSPMLVQVIIGKVVAFRPPAPSSGLPGMFEAVRSSGVVRSQPFRSVRSSDAFFSKGLRRDRCTEEGIVWEHEGWLCG